MKRVMWFSYLLLFAPLLHGVAGAANLVANPDFDSNLQGWSNQGTVAYSWDGSDGSPGLGSIHFLGPANSYLGKVMSDCIAIGPAQRMDLLVNVKVLAGTARAQVMESLEVGCPGAGYLGTAGAVLGGPCLARVVGDKSCAIRRCKRCAHISHADPDGNGNADIRFDHVELIPDVVPVTLQSFDVQ